MVAGLRCTNSSDPVLVADIFIRSEKREKTVTFSLEQIVIGEEAGKHQFDLTGTAGRAAVCKDVRKIRYLRSRKEMC